MKTLTIIFATTLIFNSCADKKIITKWDTVSTVRSNECCAYNHPAKKTNITSFKKKRSKSGLIIINTINHIY